MISIGEIDLLIFVERMGRKREFIHVDRSCLRRGFLNWIMSFKRLEIA